MDKKKKIINMLFTYVNTSTPTFTPLHYWHARIGTHTCTLATTPATCTHTSNTHTNTDMLALTRSHLTRTFVPVPHIHTVDTHAISTCARSRLHLLTHPKNIEGEKKRKGTHTKWGTPRTHSNNSDDHKLEIRARAEITPSPQALRVARAVQL